MYITTGKSILLVEDEAILGLLEKGLLEREGYKVFHVLSGEEALDYLKLEKSNIDLILMDIDLGSGLDGTETARQILFELSIPIVFLSSHTEREVVQKTEEITSYGYVVKDSGITVLDASIKMAFKLFEANEHTKSQKEHLETILSSIGDAVIATDRMGKIVNMNPVAEKLTGWNFREANGEDLRQVLKIVHSYTREAIESPVDKVLRTDQIVELGNHTVLLSKTGNEYQISDSGSPIKNSSGSTVGVVLVFRDVSEDYKFQEKITKQANMLNNITDSVVGTNLDLTITYWNKAAERIYGWTEEEAIGKNSKDLLQTNFLEVTREEVLEKIHKEGSYFGEVLQKDKFGNYVNIEVNSILLKNDRSEPIGYIAVGRDISERLSYLRQIQKSESTLTQILDTAMDAIISIDEGKSIILFNKAAEHMFGYKSEDVMGKNLDILIPLRFRPNHSDSIDRFAKTGVSQRSMGSLGKISGIRKSGNEFPIEASISQINLNGEKIFTVILRDRSPNLA